MGTIAGESMNARWPMHASSLYLSPASEFLAALEVARRALVSCAQRDDRMRGDEVDAIERALGDLFALFMGIRTVSEGHVADRPATGPASQNPEIHLELLQRAMDAYRRRELSMAVRRAEIALWAARAESGDAVWLTSLIVELMSGFLNHSCPHERHM